MINLRTAEQANQLLTSLCQRNGWTPRYPERHHCLGVRAIDDVTVGTYLYAEAWHGGRLKIRLTAEYILKGKTLHGTIDVGPAGDPLRGDGGELREGQPAGSGRGGHADGEL